MGAHSFTRRFRYTPIMIIGAVAAAFYAQSSGDVVAIGSRAITPLAAECAASPTRPEVQVGQDLSCSAYDEGSSAQIYWDGVRPVDDGFPFATAFATEGSTAVGASRGSFLYLDASGESQIYGSAAGTSDIAARASAGGTADLRAVDRSEIRAFVDAAYASVTSEGSSSVTVDAKNQAIADIVASGGSVVLLEADGSIGVIRASGGSIVRGTIEGGTYTVESSGGSEVNVMTSGSTTDITAQNESFVALMGTDTTATVNAYNGSVVQAQNSGGLIDLAANQGAILTEASGGIITGFADRGSLYLFGGDSLIDAAAVGSNAVTLASAVDGGVVTARSEGNAGAFVDSAGPTIVDVVASGDGAEVQLAADALDDEGGVAVAYAYNGALAHVQAFLVDGRNVTAAAAGAGSQAIVLVDMSRDGAPTFVTVVALNGGTAYWNDEVGEFGCVGGTTTLETDAGSCYSDGNRTVYLYADGSTATFFDLEAPDQVDRFDRSNLPPIERPDTGTFRTVAVPTGESTSASMASADTGVGDTGSAEGATPTSTEPGVAPDGDRPAADDSVRNGAGDGPTNSSATDSGSDTSNTPSGSAPATEPVVDDTASGADEGAMDEVTESTTSETAPEDDADASSTSEDSADDSADYSDLDAGRSSDS
ncbi:hypothetical protein HQ602_14245 [Rhodococcus kroppenstedtii]|uniref:hypothetical protein n=1 Tax=Rhodococcoides kroppenstedtii TaxID=293050 RepID=UPI001C9A3D18|nr:hypothetical protein [Rhodococcus kroppenstedtii]MBY6437544.1 hypothetical protein [Rhodococcus kroppenstedtii]